MKQFTVTLVALLFLTALAAVPTLIPRSDATPTQPVTTATPPPSVVRDVPIVSVPALPSPAPVVIPAVDPPGLTSGNLRARGSIAEPIIGGRATWYPASGNIAAAGPALRHYLGKHWRGTLVSVCHRSRCLVVRLGDYCGCHGNGGRLIDLSDDAFAQLAPLSRGVIAVSITRTVRVPPPPATDTAP